MVPDIGVLGPYTYLATEVAFGAVAAALLWYSGAWRRAGITIAALYPVGYVWDWYTLEVGVFAIPLRTGVELLGIPIEEHLFMIVVPAVVIGAHETIHGRLLADDARSPAAEPSRASGDAGDPPRSEADGGGTAATDGDDAHADPYSGGGDADGDDPADRPAGGVGVDDGTEADGERAVDEDENGDLPTCPVCGRPYEMRYPRGGFTPAMAGPDDEVCRTDRFVHVHEARGLESSGES